MRKTLNPTEILAKTKSLEQIIRETHPKQIVDLRDKKITYGFLVKYDYTTSRGNKKSGEKLFLSYSFLDKDNIRQEFNKWVDTYNNVHSHRCISNVKFLEYSCVGVIQGID